MQEKETRVAVVNQNNKVLDTNWRMSLEAIFTVSLFTTTIDSK